MLSSLRRSLTILSFHAYNIGHLSSRASQPLFAPCTPAAVMKLLESTGVSLAGANAVVLGRSDIVGNPVSAMLRNKDATVTQCHSRTKNIEAIVSIFKNATYHTTYSIQIKNADIVVAAIGKPEFIKGEWLKQGAVVIDVGINHINGMSKPADTRIQLIVSCKIPLRNPVSAWLAMSRSILPFLLFLVSHLFPVALDHALSLC